MEQIESAVGKTLQLDTARGERAKVVAVKKLDPISSGDNSRERRMLARADRKKRIRNRHSKISRKLSDGGDDESELKIETMVTLSDESASSLIETRVMLLAAGGSKITSEFVENLDTSLVDAGMEKANIDTSDITFEDPVYESLVPDAYAEYLREKAEKEK